MPARRASHGERVQRQDGPAVDRPVETREKSFGIREEKLSKAPVRRRRRRAGDLLSSLRSVGLWSAMAYCASVTSRTANVTAVPDRPRGNPRPSHRS